MMRLRECLLLLWDLIFWDILDTNLLKAASKRAAAGCHLQVLFLGPRECP